MTPMTNENTLKKQALGSVIFVVILLTVAFLIFKPEPEGPGSLDAFAQCLTEKGWTMYGAYWCPHCAAQKEMLGDGWKKIDYIECSLPEKAGQTEFCREQGIAIYPTWEFGDGSRAEGELTLEELGQRSGCLAGGEG